MMARSYRGIAAMLFVVCALFAGSAGVSPAATGSQQTLVQSFVGNWTCVSHSSDSTTFHESDVDTMYGNWLKVASTYPAQMGQPAGMGTTFFGYDAKNHRWIVAGAGTNGEYFVNYSNSQNFDGAKWINGFPNARTTAVTHSTSTQYTVDSQGPNPQGKLVTTHEVCVRR
ncbi:MAG: hypothetical protein WA814_01910 [Candidatus Baltobacteraceae bacterium]